MQFFITTPKGLEDALVSELQRLGLKPGSDPKVNRGGVALEGSLEDAYAVCLESRVAGRVLLHLKTFPAASPEQLYSGVRSIHWTQHLDVGGTLCVDFTSRASTLQHSHFGSQKVKDAIVDQFQRIKGERPSVDKLEPSIRIHVHVVHDVATVSLDLSGESLHRRGYRTDGGVAPLKENLAAALLEYAGWPAMVQNASLESPVRLVDPMAGSGTFALEALGIALGRAPGLERRYWGFRGWLQHDAAAWDRVRTRAVDRAAGLGSLGSRGIRIAAFDRSDRALEVARANARRMVPESGTDGPLVWERRRWPEDWERFDPLTLAEGERGLLIANPPYGERIGEKEDLKTLYAQMGDGLKKKFKGWKAALLVGDAELSKTIGLKPDRRIPVWNGPIECRLLTYSLF